jgi:hypothetical protein
MIARSLRKIINSFILYKLAKIVVLVYIDFSNGAMVNDIFIAQLQEEEKDFLNYISVILTNIRSEMFGLVFRDGY